MFIEISNTMRNQARVLESDFPETEKADEDADGKKKKRRGVTLDLALQFPSRGSLRSWMEAAAVLNLRHVALLLKHKPGSTTGHKTSDVKASHLALKDKDTGKRDAHEENVTRNGRFNS